ncbi:MAG: hypothetical protein LBC10_01880 [Deltaproteobacteria bacterium]|jgi:hypothetical protein|nr:hypothetical protein [Deltaproteobacteria bacterium]
MKKFAAVMLAAALLLGAGAGIAASDADRAVHDPAPELPDDAESLGRSIGEREFYELWGKESLKKSAAALAWQKKMRADADSEREGALSAATEEGEESDATGFTTVGLLVLCIVGWCFYRRRHDILIAIQKFKGKTTRL